MIKILNIGMNHRTAPVALRECLAQEADNELDWLTALKGLRSLQEGLLLSTCNRVEILLTTGTPEDAHAEVTGLMARLGRVAPSQVEGTLYHLEGMDAVTHIFRVASSLDSQIVGEPQILGQVKQAYRQAVGEGTAGVVLNRLMHRAFHVAKRVRTETEICEAAVSVSYAAVELARKIFQTLDERVVLVVGAGDMAELMLKHLVTHGVRQVYVANRTFDNAVRLARRFGAKAIAFSEIDPHLAFADIVLTSTAAGQYVFHRDQVKALGRARRNRPLFFIDVAVPRNVDPALNEVPNVYVYNIDDLKGIIEGNQSQREREALKAERIVAEEVLKFDKWLKTLAVVPTIAALKGKKDAIVENELRKSRMLMGTLSAEQERALKILVESIAEKILNDPIVFLKRKSEAASVNTYLDVTRKLFKLNNDKEPDQ